MTHPTRHAHDVVLVTWQDGEYPDPDEQPLLDSLEAAGVSATTAAWTDESVDWDAATLTFINSPWDYTRDRDAFLTWARRAAGMRTVLRNPLDVIIKNSHKSYLATLEKHDVPVVPTRWFATGSGTSPDAVGALPWDDLIVKPAVGADSHGVQRFDLTSGDGIEQATAHIEHLRSAGEVMAQPHLQSIAEHGETDVVWIDGEVTHAVVKHQRLADGDFGFEPARSPTSEEAALCRAALDTLPQARSREILYARVDMAPDELGTLRVIEMELVEPLLFLSTHEPAMDRLVQAIRRETRS